MSTKKPKSSTEENLPLPSAIPTDRGVVMSDLDALSELFLYQKQEAQLVFGIVGSRWSQMTKTGANTLDPESLETKAETIKRLSEEGGKAAKLTTEQIQRRIVDGPTLALMARLLASDLDIQLFPKAPEALELYKLMNSRLDDDEKLTVPQFAAIFGHQASNGQRWLKGVNLTRLTQTMMYIFWTTLVSKSEEEGRIWIKRWIATVRLEGSFRGVPDPLDTLSWNHKIAARRNERQFTRRRRRIPKIIE